MNSRWFTVPGLATVVLAIISILLTAMTVAREWENGSMELLLSTPVHPVEIILGKLAPYVVLGLTAQALIYFLARFYFGIPFMGSHLLFILGTFLFVASYMALGLLISVTTRQQILAMQFSMMIGMLPNILLSGFIFPIENMPAFFQYLTALFPARWFVLVIRGSFLRGSDLYQLAVPLLVLLFMAVFFVTWRCGGSRRTWNREKPNSNTKPQIPENQHPTRRHKATKKTEPKNIFGFSLNPKNSFSFVSLSGFVALCWKWLFLLWKWVSL